jgi:hypothetical protein
MSRPLTFSSSSQVLGGQPHVALASTQCMVRTCVCFAAQPACPTPTIHGHSNGAWRCASIRLCGAFSALIQPPRHLCRCCALAAAWYTRNRHHVPAQHARSIKACNHTLRHRAAPMSWISQRVKLPMQQPLLRSAPRCGVREIQHPVGQLVVCLLLTVRLQCLLLHTGCGCRHASTPACRPAFERRQPALQLSRWQGPQGTMRGS